MAVPPIPTPLDHLGERVFSFYPPIANIDHNEWRMLKATWSEILVANTKDGQELWVPRRLLGNVSAIDEPVLIVGLTKELEYKAGQLLPTVRRVIEMPRGALDRAPAPAMPAPPAPRHGIGKLEDRTENRIGRLIMWALGLGIVACVILIAVFRTGRDGTNITYRAVVQSDLGLSAADDYYAVVRKLGSPAADRRRANEGELQYRLLEYPDRGVFVVLMGADREKELYIGALDREWRVVDSVTLHGGDTAGLLRSLKRF